MPVPPARFNMVTSNLRNRKWYCERAQKGSEGFGSPGQLSTHPKGANFLSLSQRLSLSPVTLVGRQPKQRSGVQKGSSWTNESKCFLLVFFKTAAVLFSLSHFQSADFYYLATLARVLWLIWQVFVSCVAVVEICSRSYILPLRCSNKQWSRLWLQSLLG